MTVRLPEPHGARRGCRMASAAQAAGCGALVYGREVREKPQDRAGFGGLPRSTEFGRLGRRSIKNAVGAMEASHGRRVVFLTLTVPGRRQGVPEALARWTGKIVELISHWVLSHDKQAAYCYVWERHKDGTLHLHAAVASQKLLALRAMERDFKTYVHKLWLTVSRLAGVDMFARGDGGSWRGCVQVLRSRIEPIRKSVKRYMSKYLTKGAGEGQGFYPSRWWGMSKRLRALVACLRRCNHHRISCWEQASNLAKTGQQLAESLGCTWYFYSPPGSPSSGTLLVYPEEPDVERVFLLLSLLAKRCKPWQRRPKDVDDTGLPVQAVFEAAVRGA